MRACTRSVLVVAATTALVTTMSTYAGSSPRAAAERPSGTEATAYAWTVTPTGTTERFRGLAPVSRDVAWVSGTNGTVLPTTDVGATWTVADSPVAGGPSAGIFSVSFRDARRGVVVGGDFATPTGNVDNAAWTEDGGATWTKSTANPSGYRSGSAWVSGTSRTVLAVGPSGSDVSSDGGRTWATFDTGSFDSVECTNDGACWASGEQGRVGTLTR